MFATQQHSAMPPPPSQNRAVAPETFMLDPEAQQSLPPDSVIALQQVDNREYALILEQESTRATCLAMS